MTSKRTPQEAHELAREVSAQYLYEQHWAMRGREVPPEPWSEVRSPNIKRYFRDLADNVAKIFENSSRLSD